MESKTIDKIIELISEIPEEQHAALYAMIKEFRRSGGKMDGKWSDFTGIMSDIEAEIMLVELEETLKKDEEDK